MEALNSAETTLQWFWIIEYLTTLQQVAVGVLNDLVEESPPFPADLKRKIDELIALRTLEEICEAGDKSAAGTGIDLSETCLNVLNCILKEASISDIMTRTKPLLFDIRPFILHKRAAMPKSTLQQMFSEKQFVYNQGPVKETISWSCICQMLKKPMHKHNPNFASLNNDLEGASTSKESFPIDSENFAHEDHFLHPNAKKLKQTVPNTSETEISVPNPFEIEKLAAVPDGVEGVGLGNEVLRTVENSNSDNLKSGRRLLEGDSIRSSVLPLKKRMFGLNSEYSENLAENLQECEQNREDLDLLPKAKKLRCSIIEPEEEPAVVNVNGRTDAEKVGGGAIKENYVNCVEPREISYSGSKNQNLVQESTAMDVSADGLIEKARSNLSADGLEHKEDIVECNTEFDLDMNVEQVIEKDPTSSRDEIDITLIESLSSKEQNVCVKCKQGSHLLVCQTENCALVVHAKCLGFSKGLDVFRNFYCPSCAYADAEAEYCEAEKEASLLRADLNTFFSSGFEVDFVNICGEGQNLAGNDQNKLDNSKGGNQEICEDKVTNSTDGMNLGRDSGNGGNSHEKHPEKHSDADGGVRVREEHIVLIDDIDEGTKEDEINMNIHKTDEAKTKEALDDLHADGYRTPEHEHENRLSDESPVSPPDQTNPLQKQKETKVTTPWQKLISFGTSIFMAGLGGSDHKKK